MAGGNTGLTEGGKGLSVEAGGRTYIYTAERFGGAAMKRDFSDRLRVVWCGGNGIYNINTVHRLYFCYLVGGGSGCQLSVPHIHIKTDRQGARERGRKTG